LTASCDRHSPIEAVLNKPTKLSNYILSKSVTFRCRANATVKNGKHHLYWSIQDVTKKAQCTNLSPLSLCQSYFSPSNTSNRGYLGFRPKVLRRGKKRMVHSPLACSAFSCCVSHHIRAQVSSFVDLPRSVCQFMRAVSLPRNMFRANEL